MEFSFKLGHCNACRRFKALRGKRCYDCYVSGYTKRSKNIPWRVNNSSNEK